jgi:hypothetical protein
MVPSAAPRLRLGAVEVSATILHTPLQSHHPSPPCTHFRFSSSAALPTDGPARSSSRLFPPPPSFPSAAATRTRSTASRWHFTRIFSASPGELASARSSARLDRISSRVPATERYCPELDFSATLGKRSPGVSSNVNPSSGPRLCALALSVPEGEAVRNVPLGG